MKDNGVCRVYRFAGLVLDAESGELLNGGETIRLQQAVLVVLLALLRSPGQVVSRQDLYAELWRGAAAEHRKGLDTAVKKLRKALGGRGRYIETVTGQGYRISANVFEIERARAVNRPNSVEGCVYPKPPVQLTPTSEADRLFLRGFLCWHKRTSESLSSGLSFFTRARELEPGQARHSAAIAITWNMIASDGAVRPVNAIAQAREAAVQALRLDNANLMALCVLGNIRGAFEYDLAGGAADLRAAVAIEPRDQWGYMPLSFALLAAGDFGEGIEAMRTAVCLDPVSPTLKAGIAFAHYIARDYGQAMDLGRAAVDRDPDFGIARFYYAQILLAAGRHFEAIDQLRVASRIMGDSTDVRALLATAYTYVGDLRSAEEIDADLAALAEARYVGEYYRAVLQDVLGRREAAIRLLEQAGNDRCHWFALAAVDPKLDRMRGDQRVQALIARLLRAPSAAPEPCRAAFA